MDEPLFLNLDYFFDKILQFFRGLFNIHQGSWGGTFDLISTIFSFVAVLLILLITYILILMWDEVAKHDAHVKALIVQAHTGISEDEKSSHNPRWKQVQAYLESKNPGDWKLAIIEADSMLEDLIEGMGIPGESLGVKLQGMDPGDFPMLQAAWEAHKIRNKIAHQGSMFNPTYAEVQHIVSLYEQIFKERGFI